MAETPMQKLPGTVEHIVYSSEDTGFTVLEIDSDGELVTVVGTLPAVAPGEELILTGRFTSHPTYGQQFKAELCERTLPATASAIRKYLASGAIKGIGPKTAIRIVEIFGDETLEIIEKNPMRLAEVPGISKRKATEISEEYKHIFGIRAVMLFLSRYDIEPSAAIRVWKTWGMLAVDVITNDPYQLCIEAIGVAFETADMIAAQMDMDTAAPQRIAAGIRHVLIHNLGNGHTCLPRDKLLPAAAGLLGLESYLLEDVLESMVADSGLIADTVGGIPYIYLPDMYEAETYIAGRLKLMLDTTAPEGARCDADIAALEQRLGIEYARLQRKAIAMALESRVFILTGGPGTGKTTTLNGILSILEAQGAKVALAAPTGRAAKRMSELCGREAKTIHRLLEVDYRNENDPGIKFKRDEKNPLRFDVIILDEVSMVDTRLMHSLMKAMKLAARLILVGDPDQLPSVGAGNILRDLITSDIIPMVHLSEIFRQAQASSIVSNAHQIVRGEEPDLGVRDNDFFFMRQGDYGRTLQTVVDLCATRLPKAYGFSPLWDIQVIAPSRVGALGTVELNKVLQQQLNPKADSKIDFVFGAVTFRERDKVMQVRNNYDIVWKKDDGEQGTGVFNGDIGVIEMIDRPSRTILVRFEDRVAEYNFDMADEMEHAYAITVHKSQGSEFEAVVMPLMNYHQKLYYRNILYTAVTRARKILIMLGKPETVSAMVANHRKVLRYTNLAGFIADGMEA
ncbi:MAG: ATP-dependent RecD-like DNA helicase [Oscillospiraceae bacterium]|jgi:exodeoxyribonuclease V alpha subunit|nr:ATP-dependent RecD-like DNA helicase [Oscillospiraceae bacterium]